MNSVEAFTASTAWTVPSAVRWNSANLPAATSPRMTISVASNGIPAICRRSSYWSDQNQVPRAPVAAGRRSPRQPVWPAPARSERSPAAGTVVQRQWPFGAVADGENLRVGRAGIEIDHDATVAGQPGVARQFLVGHAADTDQRGIARNDPSIGQPHAGHFAAGALQRLDPGTEFDRHPLRSMKF